MFVDGQCVLRRVRDDWFNLTHVLKAAGVGRSERLRSLAKESKTGTVEKVQAGHQKYQGTWVPMARAREVAHTREVLDQLQPLFSYVA